MLKQRAILLIMKCFQLFLFADVYWIQSVLVVFWLYTLFLCYLCNFSCNCLLKMIEKYRMKKGIMKEMVNFYAWEIYIKSYCKILLYILIYFVINSIHNLSAHSISFVRKLITYNTAMNYYWEQSWCNCSSFSVKC